MKVRLANPSDLVKIVAFNKAMALETEGRELKDQVIEGGVEKIFKDSNHGFYLVAEESKKIIGTLMVTKEWSDWRNGQFWWIQSVFVIKDYRRKGVYRSMYTYLKKLASSNPDICGFRLYVDKDNNTAQAVYRYLGMKETLYLIYEEEF